MPHEIDDLGYPTDPELRRMEFELCELAERWRAGDLDQQPDIVRRYHDLMTQLYSRHWDGVIDLECELPLEFMPEEYLRRHPGGRRW